jgi:hypothetical protein
METKTENFKINVGCGRIASIDITKVKENHYIKIGFSNDQKGMSPVDISKHPDLIINALSEIKIKYPDYEPKCLLYQAPDWVMYHFKRIL